MDLGTKIKEARLAANLSQQELADAVHITKRTLQYYETENRNPRNTKILFDLAQALGVDSTYFISTDELGQMQQHDEFLSKAAEQAVSRGKAQAQMILEQTNALFACGDLPAKDQEAFFLAMAEIYVDAKNRAKKYGVRKRGRTSKAKTDE